MKKFSERILEHLNQLDRESLQGYLVRLIQDRHFLESVFNTIREGVLVIDHSLRIQFANSAAAPLLGIRKEDVGESIEKFFRQLPWHELTRPDAQIPANSRRELEIFYPEHRVLSFYLMPIPPAKGKTVGALDATAPFATLIFQDVTESVQAAEVNAENQKVKAITQLAAGVAHELGNPLNALGIHLQLLQRLMKKLPDSPETKKAGEFLDVSRQEIRRLDAIVKNFLSAVRPVPLQSKKLNLPAVIEKAVQFMQKEMEDRSIQLKIHLPQEVPAVFGDEDQLMQAFFNLIKNAIQAMPDGGTLSLLCNLDDLYVNITFADTGKGISEEEMRQLLDPFFTTKSAGTGLGLLIVDRIIRAHGGSLTIAGEPGKGAAITISLPRHTRQVRLLT